MSELISTNGGDLPVEFYAAIGQVTVLAARVEAELTDCIAIGAGQVEGESRSALSALIAGLPLRAKLDRLKLLASRELEHNGEPFVGALNRVVEDHHARAIDKAVKVIGDAFEERNRTIHGVWGRGRLRDDPAAQPVTFTNEKNSTKHRSWTHVVEIAELESLVQVMKSAQQHATMLHLYLMNDMVHDFFGEPERPDRFPETRGDR